MGLDDGGRSGADGGSFAAGGRKEPVGFTFVVAEPLLVGLGFLRHFSHGDPSTFALCNPIQTQVMTARRCVISSAVRSIDLKEKEKENTGMNIAVVLLVWNLKGPDAQLSAEYEKLWAAAIVCE